MEWAKELPAIIDPDEVPSNAERRQAEWEAARRMRAIRAAMEPLNAGVKELIEEGRER